MGRHPHWRGRHDGAGIFVLVGSSAGRADPALVLAAVIQGIVAVLTALGFGSLTVEILLVGRGTHRSARPGRASRLLEEPHAGRTAFVPTPAAGRSLEWWTEASSLTKLHP